MKDLVFIDSLSVKAMPYTTSEVIAEYAGAQHHTITRIIRKHRADFESFGILGFEIQEIAGRGQPEKLYRLNEQQSTLLITYLKNTEPVRLFKQELVRQFYLMRDRLTKQAIGRERLKPTTRSMTDAIRDNTPPEQMHRYTYSNYIKLAYKAALGRTAQQIKQERRITDKAVIADYMTPSELDSVKRMESVIAALLDAGLDYEGIKETLCQVVYRSWAI